MLAGTNFIYSASEQMKFRIPFFTIILMFPSLALVPQEGEHEIFRANPDLVGLSGTVRRWRNRE